MMALLHIVQPLESFHREEIAYDKLTDCRKDQAGEENE